MKKFTQKKKNNKGFSLVELIVVIAIMAVLMAVLVPTLIKNVEKSRLQTDKSALAELRQATITALAQDKYIKCKPAGEVGVSNGQIDVKALFDTSDTTGQALADEVADTVGVEKITLKSALSDDAKVTLKFDARIGEVVLIVKSEKSGDFYINVEGEGTDLEKATLKSEKKAD